MNNKLVASIVSVTVIVILTATLLVPITNDAADGITHTYHNVTGQTMSEAPSVGEVVIEFTNSGTGVSYSINGSPITLSPGIIFASDFAYFSVAGDNSNEIATRSGAIFGNVTNAKIILTASTVEIYAANALSADIHVEPSSISWGYYATPEGAFRGSNAISSGAFVTDSQPLYCCGTTLLSGAFYYYSGIQEEVTYGSDKNEITAELTTSLNEGNVESVSAYSFNDGSSVVTPTWYVYSSIVEGESTITHIEGLIAIIPLMILIAALTFIIKGAMNRN